MILALLRGKKTVLKDRVMSLGDRQGVTGMPMGVGRTVENRGVWS
jgi:hypothetical protein